MTGGNAHFHHSRAIRATPGRVPPALWIASKISLEAGPHILKLVVVVFFLTLRAQGAVIFLCSHLCVPLWAVQASVVQQLVGVSDQVKCVPKKQRVARVVIGGHSSCSLLAPCLIVCLHCSDYPFCAACIQNFARCDFLIHLCCHWTLVVA